MVARLLQLGVRLLSQLYCDLLSWVFPGSMTILAITLAVDFKLESFLSDLLESAPPLQDSAIVHAFWFSSPPTSPDRPSPH